MRRLAMCIAFLAFASCSKKAEEPVDEPAIIAQPQDSGIQMGDTLKMETGGMPVITDTTRIPSEDDSVHPPSKKEP